MSHPRPIAHSYDEITRLTVIEPDTSFRPTEEQERSAIEHIRLLDEDELWLYWKIHDALLAAGDIDIRPIRIEVERDHVLINGFVHTPSTLDRVEQLVRSVEGVGPVTNHLVVGPT